MDVEAEKRVYDYLQNSERSISKEAIRSINEYLDLIEERKTEDSFLDRVTATIEDSLKALTPLLNLLTLTQPVAQPQQAVPASKEKDSAAEENMLEFLEGCPHRKRGGASQGGNEKNGFSAYGGGG